MTADLVTSGIPYAIQWHEGMLLMPQHFQQLSARTEGLIRHLSTLATPYLWGISAFEFDRSALVSGRLRVNRVSALMRDGFWVEAGSDAGIELELDLKQADQPRSGTTMIHLVVPAQGTLSTRGDLARFQSFDGEAIADETTGEGAIPIPRLRPRVSLWAGPQPPSRFESLPLLEVNQQGETFLESGFIPPMLSVSPVSPLGSLCGAATGIVREKTFFLADKLRGGAYREGDAEQMETRARVQSLAAGLPLAEAALQSGHAHPFQLYLAMCQLAGHVARVTFSLVPPQFAPYRHDDLRASFLPVTNFIQQSVTEAVVESWKTYPFRFVNQSFELPALAALDQALVSGGTLDDPNLAVALRPAPGQPEESAVLWGEGCLIGSSSSMPRLLSNRVLGVERRLVERMPDLNPPRGVVLFALHSDDGTIKPGEGLQLLERSGDDIRPSEAVLYVRRPKNEKAKP
jgi:type VI secretion system protein ImpJ